MEKFKNKIVSLLRNSEKYTKTDMLYLAQNTFWLNLNNILTSAFAFVLSIIFAKFVSKEVYGNFQFLLSLASVVGTLTLTGMNAGVIQAVARGFEGVFKKSVDVQIRFSIIPFIFGILASVYYFLSSNIEISIALIFISVLLPLSNALNTWTAFLSGKKEFKNIFWYSQISNILYYGSMIACILIFPKTIILVAINFITLTLANLCIHIYTSKKYKPNQNFEEEAIDYGKKLSLSSIMPLIALNIDNILVFHLLGASSLAVYAFASNLPDKFMSLIRPISTIALPKIANKNPEEFRKELGHKVSKFFILAIFMALIYIICAPFFYSIFFPNYKESIPYSQIYIFATAISTVAGFIVSFMFASRSNQIYKYNLWNPIFNILIMVLGAYTFGIWGVIFGRIVGSSFSLFFGYSLSKTS